MPILTDEQTRISGLTPGIDSPVRANPSSIEEVVAIFIVKLLDPVTAIIGGVFGALCRRWWQTLIVALIAVAIVEMILSATQYTRHFSIPVFVVGFVTAEIWATIGFLIGQRIRNRNKVPSPGSNKAAPLIGPLITQGAGDISRFLRRLLRPHFLNELSWRIFVVFQLAGLGGLFFLQVTEEIWSIFPSSSYQRGWEWPLFNSNYYTSHHANGIALAFIFGPFFIAKAFDWVISSNK